MVLEAAATLNRVMTDKTDDQAEKTVFLAAIMAGVDPDEFVEKVAKLKKTRDDAQRAEMDDWIKRGCPDEDA